MARRSQKRRFGTFQTPQGSLACAPPCACSSPTSSTPAPSKSSAPSRSRSSTTRRSRKESLEAKHPGGRHPGRPLDRGHRRGHRQGPPAPPHRAGGGRVQHHRRAGGEPARHLRRQLPGEERRPRWRSWSSGCSSASTGASRTRSPRSARESGSAAKFGGAEGIHGKTLGIAGFGAVGREVAARARGFGHARGRVEPVAHARRRRADLGVGYAASLEELAARSNVLSPPPRPSPTARAAS